MKKFILNIILFFVIVTAFDLSFGFIINYFNANAKGGTTKELNDLISKDKYDILILGSSQAHHHYNPSIIYDSLGLSTYNAGKDGNGIIYAYGIYKLISQRYSPKILIYNVTPEFDFLHYAEDDKNIRYLKGLKRFYTNPNIKTIFTDINKIESIKNLSFFYRYNSIFLNPLKDYTSHKDISIDGYEPLYGEIADNYEVKRNESHNELDLKKLKYIHKLINETSKNGTKLIFVSSPKFKVSESSILDPIREICLNNKIPFFNYFDNSDYIYNRKIFKDPVHLNNKGADIFTKQTVHDLKTVILK